MANKNLSTAKKAKQDEFYTQMNDIQVEINAYLDYDENTFRDKTVLLPCDDPEWSNFTLFFAQNFERLGLKKLIGGEMDTKLLNVRVFGKKDAKAVYAKQTAAAEKRGVSNCPLCAVGHEAGRTRIWAFEEMDADHVTAWSKGGATDICNCQMLCRTHNRAKGNR